MCGLFWHISLYENDTIDSHSIFSLFPSMVFKVNHLVYKTNNFYVLNTMNNFSTSGEYNILIRAIVHSVSLSLREIFRILSRPTEFSIGFFLPEMVLLRFESEFFLLLEIKRKFFLNTTVDFIGSRSHRSSESNSKKFIIKKIQFVF